MTDIVVTGRIDRPPAEVFAFLCDMAQNPTWQKGQVSCVWTSEPPIDVGSTYDQHASFSSAVTSSRRSPSPSSRRGSTIRIVSVGRPMPIDVTRSVKATGDWGCEVTAHVRGEAPRPAPVARAGHRLDVRRNVRADYRRLKAHLEG